MRKYQTAADLLDAFLSVDEAHSKIRPYHFKNKLLDWLGIKLVISPNNSPVSRLTLSGEQATLEVGDQYYNYLSWRNLSLAHAIAFYCLKNGSAIVAKEELLSESSYDTAWSIQDDSHFDLSNVLTFAAELLMPAEQVSIIVERLKSANKTHQDIIDELVKQFFVTDVFAKKALALSLHQ